MEFSVTASTAVIVWDLGVYDNNDDGFVDDTNAVSAAMYLPNGTMVTVVRNSRH